MYMYIYICIYIYIYIPGLLNTRLYVSHLKAKIKRPDWYCADFCKYIYISSITKIQSQEKSFFHELFLTLLTHQHHFVEFYLTKTKTALETFQVITCSLGVTYNVNVRHTKSMMLNTVVSHAIYKSFFD